MTNDLVKRLRNLSECAADIAPYIEAALYEAYEAMSQAADCIEELEAALREIQKCKTPYGAYIKATAALNSEKFK